MGEVGGRLGGGGVGEGGWERGGHEGGPAETRVLQGGKSYRKKQAPCKKYEIFSSNFFIFLYYGCLFFSI